MRLGKRERKLAAEIGRWKKLCRERAELVPFVPKRERPKSSNSLEPQATKWRPAWDYNSSNAKSIARRSRPKKVG